jgi:heavy metal efflux system protein
MKKITIIIIMLLSAKCFSQTRLLTIDQAIAEALGRNQKVKASQYELQSRKALQRASADLPKTEVSLHYGQYNSYASNDNNISITQAIPFTAFGSQRALNQALTISAELQTAVTENEIVFNVRRIYYELVFTQALKKLLQTQDSIYGSFVKTAQIKHKTGETHLLEQINAEAQQNESSIALRQTDADIVRLQFQLKTLLNIDELPEVSNVALGQVPLKEQPDTASYLNNPSLSFYRQQIDVANKEKKLQASKLGPDFLLGVFTQTLIGTPNIETGMPATSAERFTGFQIGLALPLWFFPYQARARAAEFNKRAAESNAGYYQHTLKDQLLQSIRQIDMYKGSLNYYSGSGLANADLILKQSRLAFSEGEIAYPEFLLGIRNAIKIKEGYLRTLNDYNQSVIYLEYLKGMKQ